MVRRMAQKAGKLVPNWHGFGRCFSNHRSCRLPGRRIASAGAARLAVDRRDSPAGGRDRSFRGTPARSECARSGDCRAGTIFKVSDQFKGRAVFVRRARAGFSFAIFRLTESPDVRSAERNGAARKRVPDLLFQQRHPAGSRRDVEISQVRSGRFRASRSSRAAPPDQDRGVLVEDSGTRNAKGRNNTTGGS